VLNEDIDINNYEVRGADREKEIYLEGRLVDYLVEKDLSLRIVFPVSSQELIVPGKAFINEEYQKIKAAGEALSVKLKIFTCGDTLVSKYFRKDVMNSKGLYSADETAIQIRAELVKSNQKPFEYTEFAVPIGIVSAYTWGEKILDVPVKIDAAKLRYYYVHNPDDSSVIWIEYGWHEGGLSVVNTKSKKIESKASVPGFYCALASNEHSVSNTSSSFTDIGGHWAESSIEYLRQNNIIRNEGDRFYPQRNISRAEFAVYLTRLLKLEIISQPQTVFKDLKAERADYKEIITAAAAGLISGVTETSFAPDKSISRQEIAVMLARALQRSSKKIDMNKSSLNTMLDYKTISLWAVYSCEAVNAAGIMAGRENRRFAPKEYTTRAEAAAILNRLDIYLK
jgi:hypothetical protein